MIAFVEFHLFFLQIAVQMWTYDVITNCKLINPDLKENEHIQNNIQIYNWNIK